MRRFIMLCVAVLLLLSGCRPAITPGGAEKAATVAYIPLDNRPVNTTRAIYLAESAGFALCMPEESLYRTALDGQPKNPNGTRYGDGEQLLRWLESCEADYYVLSVDQILSGGLVNSRWMTGLTDERAKIDRLLSALEGKQVVLFDTVMRLAPTVGYMGCTLEDYDALRSYGAMPRPELPCRLTAEQVIAGYGVETWLKADTVAHYHSARARKLQLTAYLLEKLRDKDGIYYYCGIDDSSPQTTVQTNEIRFIQQNLTNGQLFAGTDELGLMAIAKTVCDHYGSGQAPAVHIRYFGADPKAPADAYDTGSLEQNLHAHIASLGLGLSEREYALEILVLGNGGEEAGALIAAYKENVRKKVPSILIDLREDFLLATQLLADPGAQLGCMLGYSGWNTAGNAIGIALANGLSRYFYLRSGVESVAGADEAFLQGLAFSFAKDISYDHARPQINQYVSSRGGDPTNFCRADFDAAALEQFAGELLNSQALPLSFANISAKLQGTPYLTSLAPYGIGTVPAISVAAVDFPWYRTFEADLKIQIG